MKRSLSSALREFFRTESSGGFVLVGACVAALVFANSPIHVGYESFWSSARPFINEGLMSLFFFLVGLEIKREFLHGDLKDRKTAALPIIAAFGGMITPAAIFFAINHSGGTTQGWAVPMPTDIALSIGALSLLGTRVNIALKVFLLSLAVADDLGSIIVLGTFYSREVSLVKISATLGAVLLAWVIPIKKSGSLDRLIHVVHPWSSFLVIPVFALANIGIHIQLDSIGSILSSHVSLGIIAGRVVGKILGISLFAWIALKFGIARLPESVRYREIVAVSALAGMGLTVSLFIASIAISDEATLNEIKLSLIVSAIIAATIGVITLKRITPKKIES